MKQFLYIQRDRLRLALLMAGAEQCDVKRPFRIRMVEVTPGEVRFCQTPGHCSIEDLEQAPLSTVDSEAWSDSIMRECDPPAPGMYVAYGTVRIDRTASKPTLLIEIERYESPLALTDNRRLPTEKQDLELALAGSP